MKTAPIKVKYYISPKTFAEYYFKASEDELQRAEIVSMAIVRKAFEKAFEFINMQVLLNQDNVLILLEQGKDPDNIKDYINLCSLPLDFFETLQKELPMTTQSHAFNKLAFNIQKRFITLMMKNIVAQVFTRVVCVGKPSSANYLNAEPLTFDDFKQTKHFKIYKGLSIHIYFYEVFKRLFNDQFYLEIDITETPFVAKVFDFRNNANIEYELLSYTLADFEFLNHFHRDLAKVFVSEYFAYILHNNMQQILRGAKDEL